MALSTHEKQMLVGLVQMKINENSDWLEELQKAGVKDIKGILVNLTTLCKLKDKLNKEL